jgi:hypothetical protein
MTVKNTKTMLTGGCQCGRIRYEVMGAPLAVYVCHCRECRKQSASAFGISATVRSADVRLIEGKPRRWTRPADSGRTVDCFFCPDCGSRVWHGDRDLKDTVNIKGGSLDVPLDLTSAIHIWTSRKLPGVVIPEGARQYPEEPAA